MDELEQNWPDPDRRDDALMRALINVHSQPEPPELRETLTKRECEVLTAISHGLNHQEAAEILGISHKTVKGHMGHIRRVLRAKTTAHAIAIAMRKKFIV